jgi:hypothetical protein
VNAIRMSEARIVAVLLLAASAFGAAARDDDFKCGPIDCDTLKNDPQSRYKTMIAEHIGATPEPELVNQLSDLRLKFWFTYPDPDRPQVEKPGHREAREKFARALFEKDVFYLQYELAKRIRTEGLDPSAKRGMALLTQAIERLGGGIDDGIPKAARPQFDAWVDASRLKMGRMSTNEDIVKLHFEAGLGFLSDDFRKASNPGGKEYQEYVMERDWAEFAAVNRVPAGFDTPDRYGTFLYYRIGMVPLAEATAIYEGMKTTLGREVVESAAQRVHDAPKTKGGYLVVNVAPPEKIGPDGSRVTDYTIPMPQGVIGVYTNPEVAMEVLATQDNDHRYALYLLKSQYLRNRILLNPATTKWTYAERAYQALVLAFGERRVSETAHLVRTATKRLAGPPAIMDHKAIGATRNDPFEAFEDILARKDPRGYVRAMLIFSRKPDSPDALNAAALEIDYQKLISGSDESTVLSSAQRMAAGKPHFCYRDELTYFKKSLPSRP